MAKPSENFEWASSSITDPESGQSNKVVPNAAHISNGWVFKEKPPFNYFNYWMNAIYKYVTYIIDEALEGIFTFTGIKTFEDEVILENDLTVQGVGNFIKGASYVVASSDSPTNSKYGADSIILTSADAGLAINAIITTLNSQGGGTLLLMEGTYNLSTNILPLSNVDIKGCGVGTVLKRNTASLTTCISVANAITYFTLSDFKIDGNGGTYTPTNAYGIQCANNTSNTGSKYQNIININHIGTTGGYAFSYCVNIIDSIGVSKGATASAFRYCKNNVNCTGTGVGANNSGLGFNNCSNNTNCTGTGSGTSGSGYGFGFCTTNTNCTGTGSASGGGNGYGFYECKKTLLNTGTGTGGTPYGFKTCYVDAATAVAINNGTNNDTAALGWNTGTGN